MTNQVAIKELVANAVIPDEYPDYYLVRRSDFDRLALLADTPSVEPLEVANLSTTDLPRHGVIEYDDHDEWLTESDAEGAARIVARDVPRWFGRLVEVALRPSVEPAGLSEAWDAAEAALPDGAWIVASGNDRLGYNVLAYQMSGQNEIGTVFEIAKAPAGPLEVALRALAALLRHRPATHRRSNERTEAPDAG